MSQTHAMQESNSVTMKLFNGDKFHIWKLRMKMLLMKEGLWEIVEKKNSQIENVDKKRDEKALSMIVLSLDDSQITHVENASTAHEAWETMLKIYERKSLTNVIFLKKQFYTMKMKEGDSITTHINNIITMANRLKAVGQELTDQDIVTSLLISLPKSFDALTDALEMLNEDELTLEFVKGKLLNREQKQNEQKETDEGANTKNSAFLMQRENGNYQENTCFNCGKAGHKKQDCWSKGGGNYGNKNKSTSRQRAHLAKSTTEVKEENNHKYRYAFMVSKTINKDSNTWYLDSGSTNHMVNDLKWFTTYKKINNQEIQVAKDDITVTATHSGTVVIKVPSENDSFNEISLSNVLYVSDLPMNLLSTRQLTKTGAKVVFEKESAIILNENDIPITVGKVQDDLYAINTQMVIPQVNLAKSENMLTRWHKRMGHLGHTNVLNLSKNNIAKGISMNQNTIIEPCDACMEGKSSRQRFKGHTEKRSSNILELIHTDVCGPIPTNSIGGEKYFVTFIDDYSHLTVTYLIKQKSEALGCFKNYIKMATIQQEKQVKYVRSDGGGEFNSNDFKKFCLEEGIIHQITTPYTPQLNGVAERMNRTLWEKTLTMIRHSSLPNRFWGEAILTATYLTNRSPTSAIDSNKTPYEVWTGKIPDLSHIRTFGCLAYYHVPTETRKKLDPKSKKTILMGYESNGYRLWDPENKKILVSRDVNFNETARGIDITNGHLSQTYSGHSYSNDSQEELDSGHESDTNEINENDPKVDTNSDAEDESLSCQDGEEELDTSEDDEILPRRSSRISQPSKKYWILNATLHKEPLDPSDWKLNPMIFNEAIKKFGECTIDAFATKQNKQLPQYWSKENSAFNHNWNEEQQLWINPPFNIIDEIINKIKKDQAKAILVTPEWEKETWFQDANKLSIELPLKSKVTKDTFFPGITNNETGVGLPHSFSDILIWHLDGKLSNAHQNHNTIENHTMQNENQPDNSIRNDNTIQNDLVNLNLSPTYQQAMKSEDADKWMKALKDEMNSLDENSTWTLVDLPAGRNVIGCRWVLKIKTDEQGKLSRYKARLVAKGYSQIEGLDYDETFAPVVKHTTIRAILTISNHYQMDVQQMDVKTAFLNGKLREDIFMEQPPGFEKEEEKHKVCKLHKSLYGLKQASRQWNLVLHNTFINDGFKRLQADHCVYTKMIENDMIIVAIYVDDLIIASNNSNLMKQTKLLLTSNFKMTDLGKLKYCLGWEIIMDPESQILGISQTKYIKEVLSRFGMEESKPCKTPAETTLKLKREDESKSITCPYKEAIGSLMFASIGTRPDITAAVGIVSRFQVNPQLTHWTAVKRILRYLKGTSEMGITFRKTADKLTLTGYADADWAGDLDDRKSTSGYVFMLGGGPISWKSRKQQSVALSSTEAEYLAMSDATTEAIWLRGLLDELGQTQLEPTVIHEDNQGSIALSKNPEKHSRMKHIDIRYHFIREKVTSKEIIPSYINTKEQLADILTKPIPKDQFEKLREELGVGMIR